MGIITANTDTPTIPAAGSQNLAPNSLGQMRQISSSKNIGIVSITNFSITAQSPTAAVRTYIAGSALAIPPTKIQTGTNFRWKFNLTKTAAGIAASTIDICFGIAGTTADTARLSFAKPAGTAVADEGFVVIDCVVRNIGISGVAVAEFTMIHNQASAGHALIPIVCVNTVSAGFDTTVANLIVGLCLTSGTGDVITIQMVQSECWNI